MKVKYERQLMMMLVLGMMLGMMAVPTRAQRPVYPTDLTNIAASSSGGRIISVSSTLENDPEFSANNLIDGKAYNPAAGVASKGWASNKFDPINMDWVVIGFGGNKIKRIGKVVINPVAAVAPERWAKDIEVQVSTQSAEGPYQPVAQITLRKAAERQEFTVLPADARFVRLLFRTNWGSDRAVALGEVEIYEAIASSDGDPLGQLITGLEGAINELKQFRQVHLEGGPGIRTTGKDGNDATALSPATLKLIQQSGGDAGTRLGPLLNIAAASNGGRIVDYSSVFNNDPTYSPQHLINGRNYRAEYKNPTYGWASHGFKPGQEHVAIGFRDDRTRLIDKVVINPLSYQPTLRWARRIDVQVTTGSAKQGPYRTVKTIHLRPEGVNQDFSIGPVEAKYVKFVFTANGPGDFTLPGADPDVNSDAAVSLGEIEIYEARTGDEKLDVIIGRLNQVLIGLKRLRTQNSEAALARSNEPDDAPGAADDEQAEKAQTAARKRDKVRPLLTVAPNRFTRSRIAPTTRRTKSRKNRGGSTSRPSQF